MIAARPTTIYEREFAKTEKTDAILVVDGRKMHVNKALLSYHSDYFKALFLPDSDGKTPEEYPFEDVKFEDFATLLSLIQHNPLKVTEKNAESLLALGETYEIPAAKRHVELFLITTSKGTMEKIRIADRYKLSNLLRNGLEGFKTNVEFRNLRKNPVCMALGDKSKVAICHRFWDMAEY